MAWNQCGIIANDKETIRIQPIRIHIFLGNIR